MGLDVGEEVELHGEAKGDMVSRFGPEHAPDLLCRGFDGLEELPRCFGERFSSTGLVRFDGLDEVAYL